MGSQGRGPVAPLLAGCRIVLLEAHILVALDCQDGLIEAGAHSVDIVNSATEALQRMQTGQVDAAIVDIDLGQPAGIAAVEAMAVTGVPLVVASAYTPAGPLPAAIPFVAKPYRLQELIAALAEVLAQRGEPDGPAST